MKTRVGFIGAGKLGLPVALAIDSHGFPVCVTDIDFRIQGYLEDRKIPYVEEKSEEYLKKHNIQWFNDMADVIRYSDVIFMPIQTPHDKRYEGITRLPPERKDFDYTHLIQAVKDFVACMAVSSDPSQKTLVIISTTLPGTIDREILPLVQDDKRINLVYNPYFIAMGTTIHDFLNPEFVLLGVTDKTRLGQLLEVYNYIYNWKATNHKFYQIMSIPSAELTKVAYNTFITSKICIVNTIGEICHKIPGANVDSVTNALKMATNRLISPKYLSAGLGDGGGCHPRDNIAMSWLARNLDLSYDWFENLMISRERQTEFMADLIENEYTPNNGYIVILGYEFKPETGLTTGSPALLVSELLKERNLPHDILRKDQIDLNVPCGKRLIVFIGCRHKEFADLKFPKGSTVIDPFRYIPQQENVKIISVGA